MTLLWRLLHWRKRRREPGRIAAFFKQSFELKIKGDLIPKSTAEQIIGELQVLFARHNAGAALSAKAVFKPAKQFHTVRHTLHSAVESQRAIIENAENVVILADSSKWGQRDMIRQCSWNEIGRIITEHGPVGWKPPVPAGKLVVASPSLQDDRARAKSKKS